MKLRNIFIFLVLIGLASCGGNNSPKTQAEYLEQVLENANENKAELEKAIEKASANQKEAIKFLIAYMPERDAKTLKAEFLLENLEWAYKAKNELAWAKNVPDSIFYNDVLPYVSLNERRDNWRKDFYNRFLKYTKNCKDIYEALDSIRGNIAKETGVTYNTKRKKADQSPYESMEINMASCSGLSILLTDACRAMGIPARVAGAPVWHDKRGNHNWVEVWINGKWYFTEYDSKQLDKGWFLKDAGMADPKRKMFAIYASSWKPTGISYPLVWDLSIDYVPAENVSQRYIDLYQASVEAKKQMANKVKVKVQMFKDKKHATQSGDRVACEVAVYLEGTKISSGKTAGTKQDMNDVLEFKLDKNKEYTFKYKGEKKEIAKTVKLSDKNQTLKLFYR
jgi:hypothetical protein